MYATEDTKSCNLSMGVAEMYVNFSDLITWEVEWFRTNGNICTTQVSRKPQGSFPHTKIKGC